jgi:hypothetical protein
MSVVVTLGGETDTITRTPAVATYVIEAVDRQGQRPSLKEGPWVSGSTIDVGDVSQSTVASIQLTASDATDAIVWGAVPFAALGAFDGLTIPLFVQRKGENARMPGTTLDARTAPLLAASGRGVYIAGGGDPLAAYDMLTLDHFAATCPAKPAKSFALVISSKANSDGESAMAWRIDDSGASVFGLAQCTDYSSVQVLDENKKELAWSDFAGGATVMGDDGSAYIVGPSRTTAPSGTILKIAPDSTASTSLDAIITVVAVASRAGAATAWAPKRGLFIYGGSATEVGAEIITDVSQPLPQASDATQGLAAIAFDTNTMLVAGAKDVSHKVDLTCTKDCVPANWGKALPTALSSPSLFALGNSRFLIIGDDSSTGATRVFRLTETLTDEVFLKIPRTGARGIQVETGQVVIVGGGSATPESYAD